MKTIATLTMNPCLDVSTAVRQIIHTEKMRCTSALREPGGGGINVARAIIRLGGQAAACYPEGGGTGHIISEMLREEGVTIHPQPSSHLARESFAVFDESQHRQYRFVLPGPKMHKKEWQQCMDTITSEPVADFIVASGSLPPGVPDDFYGELAHRLDGMGTRLILDTSREPLHKALQAGGIDLAKPSLRELETYCGKSLTEEAEQERICRELVESGVCGTMVLSLGEKGALLTTAGIQKRVAALPVKPISAVGAGDSFVAGMVLALSQDRDIVDAFFYGMASATATLMTSGTGLCKKEDADFFYQKLLVRETS